MTLAVRARTENRRSLAQSIYVWALEQLHSDRQHPLTQCEKCTTHLNIQVKQKKVAHCSAKGVSVSARRGSLFLRLTKLYMQALNVRTPYV